MALGINAVTPAQIAYRPRTSSASPTLSAAARLVRVHVFCEMLKTSVVSTDLLGPITVLTPNELSLGVPEVAEMWMPFPAGHPAADEMLVVSLDAFVRALAFCAPAFAAASARHANEKNPWLIMDWAAWVSSRQCLRWRREMRSCSLNRLARLHWGSAAQ